MTSLEILSKWELEARSPLKKIAVDRRRRRKMMFTGEDGLDSSVEKSNNQIRSSNFDEDDDEGDETIGTSSTGDSSNIHFPYEGDIKTAYIDTQIDFYCGDCTNFISIDWSDADVCFTNSTCFDDVLMGAIAKQAVNMKKGSFFISLTKRLPSNEFKVIENELYNMSWGGATVYVHQKVTESGDYR